MFDDNYLDSLPKDPLFAISEVLNKALEQWDQIPASKEYEEYELLIEAFAIVQALAKNSSELQLDFPSLTGQPIDVARQAREFLITTGA